MRVFVTGSTGFIGSGVVQELLSAGHEVLGLTRSNKGVEKLKIQGAEALYGTLEDLDLLKKAASECDGVIHLAFNHDFSQYATSCATDQASISALGSALAAAGGNRPLVVTSATMLASHGKLADEDDDANTNVMLGGSRGPSETVCLGFSKQGVRTSLIRLPPAVHGPGASGFAGIFADIALRKGRSAYIGEGTNHWCAVHRDDAAVLYRLALEKATPGSILHAVGDEAVQMKDIATRVGKQLDIPVVSIQNEEAEAHFGWFKFAILTDNMASSKKTQERLGWAPTGSSLIDDMPVIAHHAKARAA